MVVLGIIHALMMASNVSAERSVTGVPNSRSRSTKTHAVAHNLLQLHFHLLKQLSSISTYFHASPLAPTIRKAVKNNSK
jgi:hypothetical protein